MFIKVKYCKCGEMLYLYSKEENRRKATKVKNNIIDKACCSDINSECNK